MSTQRGPLGTWNDARGRHGAGSDGSAEPLLVTGKKMSQNFWFCTWLRWGPQPREEGHGRGLSPNQQRPWRVVTKGKHAMGIFQRLKMSSFLIIFLCMLDFFAQCVHSNSRRKRG